MYIHLHVIRMCQHTHTYYLSVCLSMYTHGLVSLGVWTCTCVFVRCACVCICVDVFKAHASMYVKRYVRAYMDAFKVHTLIGVSECLRSVWVYLCSYA